jgi:Protein of unknown function (DUF3341)
VHDLTWTAGAYAAEFASADDLAAAVRVLSDKGYTRIETYSPVPIPSADRQSRSRLPLAVFLCGVLGGIASYAIQWYANAYAYPLDIGGRPAHAIPAFLIPTFEGVVLSAALAAFFGFFWVSRLPKYWHPMFELDGFDRTTDDRYWLAIDAADRRSGPEVTPHELRTLAPLRIFRLEGPDA